jgi:cellulose synthase/poly-beta-1,6-N-acetylglucosamine synthase-like glycosyltransferase
MTLEPDVSVIIAAFTEQRWDNIVAAIDSVQRQTLPARELIVCVDHNPALLACVRQHTDGLRNVKVLDNTWPRGVSGARNTGIAAASGTFCAFLDDDAEAAPDWLASLVSAYVDPDVLGVGGAIEPHWHGGRPEWFPEEFDWVVGCSYRGLPLRSGVTRNLIGANMSFRRDVLTEVGGFRSDIGRVGEFPPVGCEDTALCIRARQEWPRGRFVYEPSARVRHSVPQSRAQWSYFLSRCYGEGASKAQLAWLFGFADSLSTERTYVAHTLPAGVAGAVLDALRRRQFGSLSRGAAIVAGLATAATGFAVTVTRGRPPAIAPVAMEVSP